MTKKKDLINPDDKYKMHPHAASLLNKDGEEESDFLPRKEINWDKVETAMAFGGSLTECAAEGGVHYNTLERRIVERYGETFRVVREAMMTPRKTMAKKALWNKVAKGDTIAILFVNRAINRMNDKLRPEDDDESDDSVTFKLAYNLNEPPPIEAEYTTKEDK